MKYRYLTPAGETLQEKVLHHYGLYERREELLNDAYEPDLQQEALLHFREALLSCQNEKIFIVGDYDCDGITSTAILKSLLQRLNIPANYYIPSRFRDGYGVNPQMVAQAAHFGFTVLLCLDNGVAAKEALAEAKELGLKVLIMDHHEYQEAPEVLGFLHPRLLKEGYRDCCTAGLAYLLYSTFEEDEKLKAYAGIASLADVVEVFGYNRYLIKEALRILSEGKVPAIDCLNGKKGSYQVNDLSFRVIPKINALSRLEGKANVNQMVNYLLADEATCRATVPQIDSVNELRRTLSAQMYDHASLQYPEGEILLFADESYQEGLCGIIAGRLAHDRRKACLVFAREDGILKGSGRSLPGGDLYQALYPYREHFLTFGGHELAVGLSLKEEEEAGFREYLASLEPMTINEEEECILLDSRDLTLQNLESLEALQPFGQGFREPLFALKDPEITSHFLVKGRYPKFVLKGGAEAISFHPEDARRYFTYLIGHPEKNNYRKGVTFRIEDMD